MTKEIYRLLDSGKYNEAKVKTFSLLDSLDETSLEHLFKRYEVAGLFIDIGKESSDVELVERGLRMLEEINLDNDNLLPKSVFYCLGNGHDSLHRLKNPGPGLPSLENAKIHLFPAKNFFYKAFKEIDFNKIEHLDVQIFTNLGNNLGLAGRLNEAISLYQKVLRIKPCFPQAEFGYGETLDYWQKVSFYGRTMSLFSVIYRAYKTAVESGKMYPHLRQYAQFKLEEYLSYLIETNFSFESIEKDLLQNETDYQNHSLFRKFCIDNLLALNEHALYCKCYSAKKDNLSIGHSQINLSHKKLVKMELLLNRLKSEFGLARTLFFEGLQGNKSDDISYNELMDGEEIGEAGEKIRTCFKMCFSMFDRIAHGICYFFDLNPERKHIYFESFWEKNEIWEKIKQKRNPHLVALYSISNDFTTKGGEFRFYKDWRNKLEHNNLVLVSNINNIDLFKLFNDESFVTKVSFSIFKEEALRLLQICCAAIFSYTYLIRTECISLKAPTEGEPYIVSPKVSQNI